MDNYDHNKSLNNNSILAIAASALLFFIASFLLLDTTMETALTAFFEPLATAIRHSDILLAFFFTITAVGEPYVVLPILLLVALVLYRRKDWYSLARVVAAGSLVFVLTTLLKDFFDIARPEQALFPETSGRFPSGHAAIGAYLAVVFWEILRHYPRKQLIASLLVLFILLISLSRLVLNVHTPLDLIAGISIAIFSYAVTILIIRKIRRSQNNL